MKIIKSGKPPEERVFNATCNNCKTEIEFKQKEGKVTHDQRDGDFITVKCPVCDQDIHVDLKLGR